MENKIFIRNNKEKLYKSGKWLMYRKKIKEYLGFDLEGVIEKWYEVYVDELIDKDIIENIEAYIQNIQDEKYHVVSYCSNIEGISKTRKIIDRDYRSSISYKPVCIELKKKPLDGAMELIYFTFEEGYDYSKREVKDSLELKIKEIKVSIPYKVTAENINTYVDECKERGLIIIERVKNLKRKITKEDIKGQKMIEDCERKYKIKTIKEEYITRYRSNSIENYYILNKSRNSNEMEDCEKMRKLIEALIGKFEDNSITAYNIVAIKFRNAYIY